MSVFNILFGTVITLTDTGDIFENIIPYDVIF